MDVSRSVGALDTTPLHWSDPQSHTHNNNPPLVRDIYGLPTYRYISMHDKVVITCKETKMKSSNLKFVYSFNSV